MTSPIPSRAGTEGLELVHEKKSVRKDTKLQGVTPQHIRESNLIEGIDSPEEDKRLMRAWKKLAKHEAIVPYVILGTHYSITLKQLPKGQAGAYRKVQVWVGNYTPPPALVVEQLVYDWCMDLLYSAAKSDPRLMHVRFEKIHPFIDGNGRTGRLLMWWHEMKLGREPTLLLNDTKQEYYQWFRS